MEVAANIECRVFSGRQQYEALYIKSGIIIIVDSAEQMVVVFDLVADQTSSASRIPDDVLVFSNLQFVGLTCIQTRG